MGILLSSQHQLRSGWRILLYILCSGALVLLALSNDAIREIQLLRYLFLSAAVLLPGLLMLRFIEKRPPKDLGYEFEGRAVRQIMLGLFQAAGMTSLLWFCALGWGSVHPGGLELRGPMPAHAAYLLVYFVFAAVFEEALFHGYAFQKLLESLGSIPAVSISAFIFALAHLANPHSGLLAVLNTVLAGVWLGIAYVRTRSLWLPTSLHFSWNFFLGPVYGFAVSGLPAGKTLMTTSSAGPVLITGGAYGPEAGLLCSVVLLGAILLSVRSSTQKPKGFF